MEVQLSIEELLRAISRWPAAELDRLTEQILMVRAERRAPHLPQAEAALLEKINEGLPPALWQRYDALKRKRRADELDATEHEELLGLTNQIEEWNAARLACLIELAQLRGPTLPTLMAELGIDPRPEVGWLPTRTKGSEQMPAKRPLKYAPLKDWLIEQARETIITVSFQDIERIIDDTLPPAARQHRQWWANVTSHPEGLAWVEAGWNTEDVDLTAERVTFRRVRSAARNARS